MMIFLIFRFKFVFKIGGRAFKIFKKTLCHKMAKAQVAFVAFLLIGTTCACVSVNINLCNIFNHFVFMELQKGYQLRTNYTRSCDENSLITHINSTMFFSKKCEVIVNGCINMTKFSATKVCNCMLSILNQPDY